MWQTRSAPIRWQCLSRAHNVPFYVAARFSSIDFSTASGDRIPIEERSPEEVTHILGIYSIAPNGVKARNIAFDVTPHKYVTGDNNRKGAFKPRDIRKLSRKNFDLDSIRLKR